MEGDVGLAQVLQGELEWKDIVKPIGEGKLSLLAAGKGPTSSLVAAQP
ncbi:hypothetical protein LCGC14_2679420, partial [marine sediment metagenome]